MSLSLCPLPREFKPRVDTFGGKVSGPNFESVYSWSFRRRAS